MFLTRLGFGSKAVITGDITQIDLPPGKESGLIEAQRVLGGIDGLEFVHWETGMWFVIPGAEDRQSL